MAFENAGDGAPTFAWGSPLYTARRMFRWTAAREPGTPNAGGTVDGIAAAGGGCGYAAIHGLPVQVESGAAFGAGAALQTDSSGRAVPLAGGVQVLRALDGATGSGQVVWCVFA